MLPENLYLGIQFSKRIIRKRKHMSIVKYNSFTSSNLPDISLSEMSYIVNSYIEESVSDLQVKCLLVDKRSLQESGIQYFTEENDDGKKKLGEKLKEIASSVWDAIIGIFNKVKRFISSLITGVKIKKLGKDYKEMINLIPTDSVAKTVEDTVDKLYDVDRFISIIDSDSGKYINMGDDVIKNSFEYKEPKKIVTKQYVLDYAFGGFRNVNKDVQKAFSKVQSKFNEENKKYGSVSFDNNTTLQSFKNALKHITTLSTIFSQMIIHNSKMTEKVAKALEKKYITDISAEVGQHMNARNGKFLLTPELIKTVDNVHDTHAAAKQKREEIEKMSDDLVTKIQGSITHYEELIKNGKLSDYEKKAYQEKLVEFKKLLNDVNKKHGKKE